MRTHDCEPTLTDRQVIQFCREGFLKLEGVVSREVTDRALEYSAASTQTTTKPLCPRRIGSSTASC